MNYLDKNDIPEGIQVYEKFCKYDGCQRDFWSTSRQTKYCCPECSDKAQGKIRKRNKVRRRKRKEYEENREINVALSNAYALAHKVADLFLLPKVCQCAKYGYTDECSGKLELHHRNAYPFDNRPENLDWMCRHHHAMADDEHAKVNMVDTYNEALDFVGFEEEEVKYLKMIEYFNNKLEV